jgi:hypothetical protein
MRHASAMNGDFIDDPPFPNISCENVAAPIFSSG